MKVESVHSSSGAFAAIRTNGSVTTWGHALSGGDCRSVETQLVDVRNVYSSNKAFAAITAHGTVVPRKQEAFLSTCLHYGFAMVCIHRSFWL